MNINELLNELVKHNISLSGRAISQIWGMDETSFSKKKKSGTQIKQKNIMQLEDALGIKLTSKENYETINNSLSRYSNNNIKEKRKYFGKRIEIIKNKNKLSDLEMAKLLNINEKELINIIKGEIQPDLNLLDNIKQNFQVSIDWLLYNDN